MTDYRQDFLEEIDFLTKRRGVILETMQQEPEGMEFWSLLLRMTNADINRNKKAIESMDGKITELDFMRWYRDHLSVKQMRLVELRDIVEASRNLNRFNSPTHRQLFEMAAQKVKDELLQESHHREQVDAAMEEIDVMYPPAEPETVSESVRHYGRFPIRCGLNDDGEFTLNADDTLAVLRVINGEIESMADQPKLDETELAQEMNRLATQYRHTPETQHFRRWLGVNL